MDVKQYVEKTGAARLRPYRLFILFIAIILLSSCTVFHEEQVQKIALIAPFEGRYREIGYDALYAVRLAIADSSVKTIDLLAIDDGGSIESAIDRAHAVQKDPAIKFVLALGPYSTASEVQTAYGDLPVLIVGHWNAQPTTENTFILASSAIDAQLNYHENDVFVKSDVPEIFASEILSLKQIPLLYSQDELARFHILSSSSLPDAEFHDRYINSAEFVPEPGLLTTLSYDAGAIAVEAIQNNVSLTAIDYQGLNGRIHFTDGYWQDAPIYEYVYDDSGRLVLSSDNPIK